MKIIIDGNQKFYQWEPEDIDAQIAFEQGLNIDASIESLVRALLKATADTRQETIEAWEQAKNRIKELDPDYNGGELTYGWVDKRFRKKGK